MSRRKWTWAISAGLLAFATACACAVGRGVLSGAALPLSPPARAYGTELFVDPNGDDSNPGSFERPLATLERARAAVRDLKRGGRLPAGGVAVTLRGGTYYRTSTLVLSAADSGASGQPVGWRAYPGESPRISGGKRLTGWTAVTSSDADWARIHASTTLYKASVSIPSWGDGPPWREGGALAELFYDGAPMQLGRWPNRDAGNPVRGMARITGAGKRLSSEPPVPAQWATAPLLGEVNRPWAYVNTNGYLDELFRIEAVSESDFDLAAPSHPLNAQALGYVTNLLEAVDEPGEYWIDRDAGVVYFSPPDGQNPDARGGEAIVSSLSQALVQADSTSSKLRFQGLTFEAGQRDLLIVNGNGNAVESCTFRNAGNAGLWLAGSGHQVAHSTFSGLGGVSIYTVGPGVPGPNRDTQNASKGVTVSHCDVHDGARYFHNGVPGMKLGGSGHRFRNNAVHHLPWSAIFLFAKSTIIELNEFHHTQQEGSDAGTIYTWENRKAAVEIRHNYFHDVPRPAPPWSQGSALVAIYLDSDHGPAMTTGFKVRGNIIYRYGDGSAGGGARGTGIVNKGAGNIIQNNLFARCDTPYLTDGKGTGTVTGNQGWVTGTSLPPGNIQQEPAFLDEVNGNLANRPDGSTVLAGTAERIPFSSIGIH